MDNKELSSRLQCILVLIVNNLLIRASLIQNILLS